MLVMIVALAIAAWPARVPPPHHRPLHHRLAIDPARARRPRASRRPDASDSLGVSNGLRKRPYKSQSRCCFGTVGQIALRPLAVTSQIVARHPPIPTGETRTFLPA